MGLDIEANSESSSGEDSDKHLSHPPLSIPNNLSESTEVAEDEIKSV